jgi:predicted DNA binding CopG/RHH family protein
MPNPYAKALRKHVTIRLSVDVVRYFKALAEQTGTPYQVLINSYLEDCVAHNRRPATEWA